MVDGCSRSWCRGDRSRHGGCGGGWWWCGGSSSWMVVGGCRRLWWLEVRGDVVVAVVLVRIQLACDACDEFSHSEFGLRDFQNITNFFPMEIYTN